MSVHRDQGIYIHLAMLGPMSKKGRTPEELTVQRRQWHKIQE